MKQPPAPAYYLRRALEWIDALPKELQLPTMPGFDRDEANQACENDKPRPLDEYQDASKGIKP